MARCLGILFRKNRKTFLEQMYPSLTLSRIFGNVLFTLDDESSYVAIIMALPFFVVYLVCCTNYLDINMFKTITVYEQVSDNLFFSVAIVGTLVRPVYFFVVRKQHKQIFLDIHRINCALEKEYQAYYSIDFILLRNMVGMIVTNITFVITSKGFQLLDATPINYFMFLMSYNACSLNDIFQYSVGMEIQKQLETLNRNIEAITLPERVVQDVMEIVNCRVKLLGIARRFNEICTLPLLLSLSLQFVFLIWILHSAFVMLVFKFPYYEYLILMISIRTALSGMYTTILFGMWSSIAEEAGKTSTYIHDIWNERIGKGRIDPHLKHLHLISLQLYNSRLTFTAYGFFQLDWTLLQRIISAIITYVVILMQFESTMKNGASSNRTTA